jgi:hypothetical protein
VIETKKLRRLIERPEHCLFWGQPHTITPRLITRTFGDGKQLLCVTPLATRPNYFVVRIDSSVTDPHSHHDSSTKLSFLDEIMDAAEDEYGAYDETEKPNAYFPVADWSIGAAWGEPFAVTAWNPTPRTSRNLRSTCGTRVRATARVGARKR